jgi:uncharacterized protein (UPF0248 family)
MITSCVLFGLYCSFIKSYRSDGVANRLGPREIFNKIFWDKREKPENYFVTFIHRGAPQDRKTIPCTSIVKVERSWFIYSVEGEETLIPFHRILEIKNIKTGKVLWRKILKAK